MGAPTLTYTLTNGTTADATQVMQNFNDLLNGITDGTKDLSISALTYAGTATLNGNVNVGNASSDDLTITASLASTLAIKTNNSFNIGAATLGLAGIYLGAPSSRSTRITAHQSLGASNTLVLPNGNGNSGQAIQGDGSGNLSFSWEGGYASKNDNYAVLDTDGYKQIDVTVVNKTITLPTASDNTNRIITIRKFVSGAGTTTIKGEAAGETVDGVAGDTGITLDFYKEAVTLICTGSVWEVLNWYIPNPQYTITVSGTDWTTRRAIGVPYKTKDGAWRLKFNIDGSNLTGSTSLTLSLSGVTFKNLANNYQSISLIGDNSGWIYYSSTGINNDDVYCYCNNTNTNWYISSDVELESKPTFVI